MVYHLRSVSDNPNGANTAIVPPVPSTKTKPNIFFQQNCSARQSG